jgi:hypothetical protein
MRKNVILLTVLLLGYLWWQSSDSAPEFTSPDLTSPVPLIEPISATATSQSAPTAAPPTAVAAIAALPAASKADTATKAAALLQQAVTLRQCWNVPLDEPALEAWLQQATQGHQTPEQIFGMQQRFAQCQHPFPATTNQSNAPNTSQQPAQQHNYLNLLLQAAALGSDAAVQQLWTLAEPELVQQLQLTDLPRDEKIKRKQQFKQQQYQLAATVAQAGGEQAALMLISGYQHYDPATGGQSYDKALAYIDFMLQTSRNNQIYSQLQWQRDRLLTRMTEAEISQAQHMTEQFLSPQ